MTPVFRPVTIIHVDHAQGFALAACGNTYLIERRQYPDFSNLRIGKTVYVTFAGSINRLLCRVGAVCDIAPDAAPAVSGLRLVVCNE